MSSDESSENNNGGESQRPVPDRWNSELGIPYPLGSANIRKNRRLLDKTTQSLFASLRPGVLKIQAHRKFFFGEAKQAERIY